MLKNCATPWCNADTIHQSMARWPLGYFKQNGDAIGKPL